MNHSVYVLFLVFSLEARRAVCRRMGFGGRLLGYFFRFFVRVFLVLSCLVSLCAVRVCACACVRRVRESVRLFFISCFRLLYFRDDG